MSESKKISDVVDEFADVVDRIAELNEELSILKKNKSDLEYSLRRLGEETGLDKFQTDRISVSITESPVAAFDPESWDNILKWCLDNDLTEVVQRRLTAKKLQSLAEDGVPFPEGLALDTVEKVTHRRKGNANG
tara:strand:+ start:185 stop:586 length:402 start_codon:yes stop_codon:yes gene_type:complete